MQTDTKKLLLRWGSAAVLAMGTFVVGYLISRPPELHIRDRKSVV